jgi:predicted protein tyrosine phosphatase
VFGGRDDVEAASAGLAPDADEIVTAETLEWADLIVVMEEGSPRQTPASLCPAYPSRADRLPRYPGQI